MSIVQCIAAMQDKASNIQSLNQYTALYITIAIAAVVFGLVLLILIRTCSRRAESQSAPISDQSVSISPRSDPHPRPR